MIVATIGNIGIGVCPCHRNPTPYTTTFISGSPMMLANGSSVAVVGSIGVSTCGHNTTAISGSSGTLAEGKPVHRVGDKGLNCGSYTVISGTPAVSINK